MYKHNNLFVSSKSNKRKKSKLYIILVEGVKIYDGDKDVKFFEILVK